MGHYEEGRDRSCGNSASRKITLTNVKLTSEDLSYDRQISTGMSIDKFPLTVVSVLAV